VTTHASASQPILELAGGLVESSFGSDVCALWVAAGSTAHDQLIAWKPDIDGNAVAVPMAVVATRELDHDVTRDDAVEEALEVLHTPLDLDGERIGMRHGSERELKGYLHGVISYPSTKQ
jgi:hypothetical protein